jgi:hypothetical protein
MSRISKRLVSIAASTVLLSLVSSAANAQGIWYTDYNDWFSLVTNVQTATYDSPPAPDNLGAPLIENGITAIAESGNWYSASNFLSTNDSVPVTFTFSGNAFGGYFGLDGAAGSLQFTVDGSIPSNFNVPSLSNGYTFVGYISDSSSIIDVKVNPGTSYIAVDSFSRANSINTSNPGSNVAPEPGSFALALTGGAALIGICIRRRRNAG